MNEYQKGFVHGLILGSLFIAFLLTALRAAHEMGYI